MFQTVAAHPNAVIVRDAAIGAAIDTAIVAAIDSAMLSRRDEYSGQPMAWKMFCEASHVATLNDVLRSAFIECVANERGADVALRLKAKAESIRAEVMARLM